MEVRGRSLNKWESLPLCYQTGCMVVIADWLLVTNFLHLFIKKKKKQHVCSEKNATACWGEMGKMCLHGSWEMPPLFGITVTFQNSLDRSH